MTFALNLEMQQGATFRKDLTWQIAEAPVDLTGYTARMQVRETVDSVTSLLELTTENGYITLGGAAGTIRLEVDAVAMAALDFTAGVYDLELASGDATPFVTRLCEGAVTLSPEVTR